MVSESELACLSFSSRCVEVLMVREASDGHTSKHKENKPSSKPNPSAHYLSCLLGRLCLKLEELLRFLCVL